MKKVRLIIAACCMTAIGMYSVFAFGNSSKSESKLLDANVEALVQDEGSGGSSSVWDCYSQIQMSSGCVVYLCGNPCSKEIGYVGIGEKGKCYK